MLLLITLPCLLVCQTRWLRNKLGQALVRCAPDYDLQTPGQQRGTLFAHTYTVRQTHDIKGLRSLQQTSGNGYLKPVTRLWLANYNLRPVFGSSCPMSAIKRWGLLYHVLAPQGIPNLWYMLPLCPQSLDRVFAAVAAACLLDGGKREETSAERMKQEKYGKITLWPVASAAIVKQKYSARPVMF